MLNLFHMLSILDSLFILQDRPDQTSSGTRRLIIKRR